METEAEKIARWDREALEPSPLPWSTRPHDSYMREDDEEPIEIVDANGDTVADNVSYYATHIKVADAHFIATRVNTHDALVAALEAVSPLVHKLDARRPQIDAALALARGGK